jgi:DNA excision repair protein ERCC-3
MYLMMARNWGSSSTTRCTWCPRRCSGPPRAAGQRRLGLTATLIREDGLEQDTFSLVGPKCYDVPWKELEQKGFIAEAVCCEVRVPLPPDTAPEYVHAPEKTQFRIASENVNKDRVLKTLLRKHADEPVLVIGST